MKKILKYLTVTVLALAGVSCSREEIVFDHEEQAFETREDRILVEAIMPQATAADDEIYIIGAFNGGEQAVGEAAYRMTHSTTIPSKWGIYLDPSRFAGDASLADGFTFYNVQQGLERSPKNTDVSHTLTIGPGGWANVYVDKWAKYFEVPEGPEEFRLPDLDGYGFFVDNAGAPSYTSLALYAWGDAEAFGGWPGMQPTGTWTWQGVTYTYFDLGAAATGLTENFIINNNGGGSQLEDFDVLKGQVIDHHFFFRITDDSVEAVEISGAGGGIPAHDGVRVWVDNQYAGWDNLTLYMWGSVNDFGGGWPGASIAGSETISGVEYVYFEYGEDIYGLSENLIFSNNGSDQLSDLAVTFDEGVQDYFVQVTSSGAVLTDGPGGDTPEPPVVVKKDPVTVYVEDLSGWDALFLYLWGDVNDLGGGWPGMEVTGSAKVGSVTYRTVVVDDALGRAENLIFNNNDGVQTENFAITLTEEVFVRLDADGTVTALDPRNPDIRILVNNKTDWDALALYAWGDAEAFGGWPGALPVASETVGGVEYTVFGLSADMAGKSLNLIFNNNGGGQQLADFAVTVPGDEIFLNINAEYYVGPVSGNPRGEDSYIYVLDNLGWGADLHLYAWGDGEIFGGWAGASGEAAGSFCGVPAYRFLVAAEHSGKKEHLIFNNGSGGDGNQFDGPEVTVGEDLFLRIEAGFTSASTEPVTRIYVEDNTGWDALYVYVWGTSEIFGGWPGAAVTGEQTLGGKTWKYAEVPASCFGNTANIIFNNNAGTQLENFPALQGRTVGGDFFFVLTGDNAVASE